MRNIKFKAFCKHINKEYDEIDLLYMGKICDVVQLSYGSKGITITVWDGENTAKDVYPGEYELLQFTGLYDKNGKEIYEGDILYDSLLDEKAVVAWDKSGCLIIGKVYACNYSAVSLTRCYGADEVIGNIYENGDLIK